MYGYVSRKAVKQEIPVKNGADGVYKAMVNCAGNPALCRFIDRSQCESPDEDRDGESDDVVSVMTGCRIDLITFRFCGSSKPTIGRLKADFVPKVFYSDIFFCLWHNSYNGCSKGMSDERQK